ncbi:MAG: trypsin-like peptidase domain-containing protein [Candidatus Pacearchaeota archaeon]|jgi:S1-C subfamily serine protease
MEKIEAHKHIILIAVECLLILSVIYLAQNVYLLKQDMNKNIETSINKTKLELESQILDVEKQNLERTQKLTATVLSVKNDLTTQVSELKASSGNDFSGIIQQSIKGVVSISTEVAQGSGFIISSDGYLVTNAHVLVGGSHAKALLYNKTELVPVKLVGYDENLDIAVLKMDSGTYDHLDFGDSSNLEIGEKAIVLGNPLGLSFSASEGIISGLKREGPNGINSYIQIDAPLNRGNSGGPLIDKTGKVIGINNFKIKNTENLGFALESNAAKEMINQILEKQKINKII